MNNDQQSSLYPDHLATLERRWQLALDHSRFEAAVILAGSASGYFLDDQSAPFRPNPHFAQWFPQQDCQHCALLIEPGVRPRLLFLQPEDYWHQPATLPVWADQFEVEIFATQDALHSQIEAQVRRLPGSAIIGPDAAGSNFGGEANPQGLLDYLHYHRAWKTQYELAAMRAANRTAALGHRAAADCFRAGGSEFDIHLAYLNAARQTPDELPYASIVALNEHAGVLHYQHYERSRPASTHSFLIDAGATSSGYAADVTRTYASDAQGAFSSLVEALELAQLALISSIRPGQNYLSLHQDMHLRIGQILADQNLITCSAQAAMATGITRTFLPHGLGHLIGLQTHDVGGLQSDELGSVTPPPDEYPALRFTRDIDEDMVFTVEPGIYFIPQLLQALQTSPAAADVNWKLVAQLEPCGGIRIEDNVRVSAGEPENLTRDAFAATADMPLS